MQRSAGTHWPSIALLVVGGLALLLNLCLIGPLALLGFGFYVQNDSSAQSVMTFFWMAGLVIVLLLPSIILAIRRLMGKTEPLWKFRFFKYSAFAMLAWMVLLGVGYGIGKTGEGGVNAVLMPLLTVLVTVIPLWFFVETGRRELSNGTLQRKWGVFNFSILVTIPLTVTLELVFFVLLAFAIGFWLVAVQPGAAEQLNLWTSRLMNPLNNPDTTSRAALAMLNQPAAVYLILALVAGAIPLLEELLKTLALWFFSRKKITRGEGFELGLLCGCAFALVESVMVTGGNASMGWVLLSIARVGTGLLHIFTSGLIGMALAEAWQGGNPLRLVLFYLGAVLVHALWNALGLFMGFGILSNEASSAFSSATPLAIFGLVALGVVMLALLVYMNHKLVQSERTLEPLPQFTPLAVSQENPREDGEEKEI